MKKITNFLLLCAFMLLNAFAATAQTAVEYQVSSAPSDGSFAEDTHWYALYLRGTYISVENLTDDGYLRAGNGFNAISNTLEKGLWCIVGDDTNGYKFYNKSEGTTKVLGISYNPGTNGESARTKMVDATLENATEQGADNWLTTFNIHKNTTSNVGAYSISVKGLTDYYFNQRSPYLAFWTSSFAKEEVGSSFYFYDADQSTLTTAINAAKSLANYSGRVGGLFQPTQEELDAYKAEVAAMSSDDVSWSNIMSISEKMVAFKKQIEAHTPVIGQKYLILNAYNTKMIIPNVIPGGKLNTYTGDNNKAKSAIWVVENGDTDGMFKLKNAYSKLYANGITINTTATDFYIAPAGTYDGNCAIGQSLVGNSCFHSNTGSDVMLWAANAGASRWYFEPISDDAYEALAANNATNISNLVAAAPGDIFGAATEAKATLQGEPSYANYLAYVQAITDATSNQYVRLQCAKSGNNRYLGLSDDYIIARSLDASTAKTNISNIWKLVPTTETGKYKLMNANTGTYITGLVAAGGNDTTPTLTDFDSGYAFKFTVNDATNNKWNVIDGNNNNLNAETNGRINYWTNSQNTGWYITKATDIEVDLHALGSASYASLYLPFSISAVDGANAYVAETAAENGKLVVKTTEDGGFAANQGVVLVSDTNAATATLTLGENSNTSLLSGTNLPITLTDDTRSNFFTFGPKDGSSDTVGFYTPSASVATIPANRAYYQSNSGQAVALSFNGSVTGIDNVTINSSNAAIYDIIGRRIYNTIKGGLYIQNGKKFIVK